MDLSLCMAAGLITVDPLAASATSVFVLTITSLKAALFQNSNQQTVQAMVAGGILGPMTLTLTGTLSTLLNLINYQVQLGLYIQSCWRYLSKRVLRSLIFSVS